MDGSLGEGLALPGRESEQEDGVRWFMRHFAHLDCRVTNPEGKVLPWGMSGTLVDCDGEWFFVTAGHCLEFVDRCKRSEGWSIGKFRLDDRHGVGSSSVDLPPFYYEDSDRGYLHEKELGVDYGHLHLRSLFRQQLESNGKLALDARAWPAGRLQFESFWLLGVPEEKLEIAGEDIEKEFHLIELTSAKPEEVPLGMQELAFPRLFLKLVGPLENGVKSMLGTSGGPVFGLLEVGGVKRYWWIGIQSARGVGTDIVAVSPIDERLIAVLEGNCKILRGG